MRMGLKREVVVLLSYYCSWCAARKRLSAVSTVPMARDNAFPHGCGVCAVYRLGLLGAYKFLRGNTHLVRCTVLVHVWQGFRGVVLPLPSSGCQPLVCVFCGATANDTVAFCELCSAWLRWFGFLGVLPAGGESCFLRSFCPRSDARLVCTRSLAAFFAQKEGGGGGGWCPEASD